MVNAHAPKLVLASKNQGKLAELRALLDGVVTDPVTQVIDAVAANAPDVVEDGVSFEENALKKAREIAAATGLVAIADDSGLAVDVLGGAPGIFSARWSGTHGDDAANTNLLLAQLSDIAEEHRAARFISVVAVATPEGQEFSETGTMEGSLTFTPRGQNGFGYDPIFQVAGTQLTAAELSAEEKNARSHRGEALRRMLPKLTVLLAEA